MSTAETNKPAATGIGAHLGSHLRENGMMLALVAIVLFFFVIVRATQGVDFLSAQNITNLFLQNSYVIVMALGMLLVIVSGHIDLSVGSVAAFTGAVSAFLTVKLGWPVWAVMPAVLMIGALIGAAQGYWIAYWKIPSFIVTLAGMAKATVADTICAPEVDAPCPPSPSTHRPSASPSGSTTARWPVAKATRSSRASSATAC